MRARLNRALAVLALAIGSSACGVLIGNVKPVDSKSARYGLLDLSKENPDWSRLDPMDVGENGRGDPGAISDVVYQSRSTASVISLNSACRESRPKPERAGHEPQAELREFARSLLLGISEVKDREETSGTLSGAPAFRTTVLGRMGGEIVKLRAVVIRQGNCVYDLLYVARPEKFQGQEAEFERFVASLRLPSGVN